MRKYEGILHSLILEIYYIISYIERYLLSTMNDNIIIFMMTSNKFWMKRNDCDNDSSKAKVDDIERVPLKNNSLLL